MKGRNNTKQQRKEKVKSPYLYIYYIINFYKNQIMVYLVGPEVVETPPNHS